MSPEEQERLARELAEQLRRLRVEDVVINTLMTVSSIGYRRLGITPETREDRDLEQARLAIDTMRALAPVLEPSVPAELIRDFNSSVANLQLAYAQAASEPAESAGARSGVRPDAKSAADRGETATDRDESGPGPSGVTRESGSSPEADADTA